MVEYDIAPLTLHALASLPKAPGSPRTTEELYRRTLVIISRIMLQHISIGVPTSDYQASFAVNAEDFGLLFNRFCLSLSVESAYCSVKRMSRIAANAKLAIHDGADGNFTARRQPEKTSPPTPTRASNNLPPCRTRPQCVRRQKPPRQKTFTTSTRIEPSRLCEVLTVSSVSVSTLLYPCPSPYSHVLFQLNNSPRRRGGR
jgi:hypothetical protein